MTFNSLEGLTKHTVEMIDHENLKRQQGESKKRRVDELVLSLAQENHYVVAEAIANLEFPDG